MTGDSREFTAPQWLRDKIARQLREGVTLSLRWKRWRTGNMVGGTEVAAIHWRPGDPNALAAIICKHVQDTPMPLNLDGQHFMIVRQHWPPGWNIDT